MKRLCIFDLDGTISNTLASLHWFGSEALRQCGFPTIDDPKKIQYMVGNGAKVLLQRMLTESIGTYTEEQLQQLQVTYQSLYRANPMHLVQPYDGVADLLAALRRRGILLAVLSNKPDALTKVIAPTLYPDVDFALCRGQVEGFPKKPAPDGALAILEALAVSPEDALYIGDTQVDMETGRNAGIPTIGVAWGFRTPAELREAGCTNCIEKPADLLRYLD